MVTFDGDGGRGQYDVCIAILNINEVGKITLRDEDGNELDQPYAQGSITADLTDPDGGVTGVVWQWERSQLNPPFTSDDDITDPMSATYTPTNADTSYFLRVTATYMDEKNDADDTDGRTAVVTATYAVLEVLDQKRAPAFPQDATEVEVAENSPSTTYVGEAIVAAVDPDKGTTLMYTLGGDDAALFALRALPVLDDQGDSMMVNTRQIVVAQPLLRAGRGQDSDLTMDAMYDPVDLNHEDGDPQTYTVELKASDGALDDTIMVTITVTDRNEAPSTPMAASGGAPVTPENNAPEFAAATDTREVAENTAAGEDIGAPVMAMDADADDTLTYTLGGSDAASFDIDGATGQLMTDAALDFETTPSYTVTVTASDGNTADDATIMVTITVTDVDEPVIPGDTNNDGMIDKPEVIAAFRAYVADPSDKTEMIAIFRQYVADSASSQ